jgi:hypothetical protein
VDYSVVAMGDDMAGSTSNGHCNAACSQAGSTASSNDTWLLDGKQANSA